MTGYTLLLDESYDEATDVYVMGGVIIEKRRLTTLTDAVRDAGFDDGAKYVVAGVEHNPDASTGDELSALHGAGELRRRKPLSLS